MKTVVPHHTMITMSTTPEEFFVKCLMEQSPPSPPVFLDLPHKLNGSTEGQHDVPNDMTIPYIKRVLLEDDIDDKLNDHPALLQVERPFAQILSSPSFGTNTWNTDAASDLLKNGGSDESTLSSALSKGMYDPVNQVVTNNLSGVKKRYNRDDLLEEEVQRTTRAVMMIKEPKENCANEIIDDMMLRGYETCLRSMEELRVTMDSEMEEKNRKSGRKAARDGVVDIRSLLFSCAQEVATNNHTRAFKLLKQIKQHASATGDATQRLAQCFTRGLEARLEGTGSLLCQPIMVQRPSDVEFLKAYNLYFTACCFNMVALIFAKMTIMQAMVGKRRLHIVDYGVHFGFQWASLLRLLARWEGGKPEVKITAIGCPKRMSYPTEQVEEIGCRLRKCAHEFGLSSFQFHAIMKWEDTCTQDFRTDADDEVLVVNDFFHLGTLMDESIVSDDQSPRDTVLDNIKMMRPDVFIQSVLNRSYGSSFQTRFRETMFFYMALFDILDATIPKKSESRFVLEQLVLGHRALNAIACEGVDLKQRPEKYRQWKARNQRAGLRQLPLKSSIVNVVKDEVRKNYHKDFFICEDGQWLLQGWMGRVLFAHSTWVAD